MSPRPNDPTAALPEGWTWFWDGNTWGADSWPRGRAVSLRVLGNSRECLSSFGWVPNTVLLAVMAANGYEIPRPPEPADDHDVKHTRAEVRRQLEAVCTLAVDNGISATRFADALEAANLRIIELETEVMRLRDAARSRP